MDRVAQQLNDQICDVNDASLIIDESSIVKKRKNLWRCTTMTWF